jgi:hypothetical protein
MSQTGHELSNHIGNLSFILMIFTHSNRFFNSTDAACHRYIYSIISMLHADHTPYRFNGGRSHATLYSIGRFRILTKNLIGDLDVLHRTSYRLITATFVEKLARSTVLEKIHREKSRSQVPVICGLVQKIR